MRNKLRVALLGGGKMALQHATAIRVCDSAELVAVTDPVVAKGELQARFGEGVLAFDDVDAMLREVKPDVVHVVTPPATHVGLAKSCLEAGAHVYVEKPFALAKSDAREVLDLAASRGLLACAAHQVLFQESAQQYRLSLPLIGTIRQVESFFSFQPVRRRSAGGGLSMPVDQLIDILPHPVYLLLNGMPREGAAQLTAVDVLPEGEVRAIVRRGNALATLIVTLRARPVESYLRVMGTNGSVKADFVIGYVVRLLGPGASAPAVVLRPFSEASQIAWGSLRGLLKLVFRRHKSYPGLAELLGRFYQSIADGGAPPVTREEILDTVGLCEEIAARLQAAARVTEAEAERSFQRREAEFKPALTHRGTVLLTGGTGMLGHPTAIALRDDGWHVRVPVRRELSAAERLPGVEYVRADLGQEVPDELLAGVGLVVHAAAETSGSKADHERNTVVATGKLLDAMQRTGVRRLVNIGSVAVLVPAAAGRVLSEDSPVDADNLGRGPYVWAKACAEQDAARRAAAGSLDLRTIRLGPLVNYDDYAAPGRLGREVARLFVAIGGRRSTLGVCSVSTAASVIQSYARDFDSAPAYVNLLEVPTPTRGALADRLKALRPDLRFVWLPFPVLRLMNAGLGVALRLLRPREKPLDLYAAFKSERYDPTVAARVIDSASTHTARAEPDNERCAAS